MDRYVRLLDWQWSHNSIASDLIRMFLGAALLVRGLLFAIDPASLADLTADRNIGWFSYYIMVAHTAGGLLLLIGLFTRIAALVQLPVVIGAVLLVHVREGLASPNQSLELAVLVLVLLGVIFVFGPGRYSVDYHLFGRDLEKASVSADE